MALAAFCGAGGGGEGKNKGRGFTSAVAQAAQMHRFGAHVRKFLCCTQFCEFFGQKKCISGVPDALLSAARKQKSPKYPTMTQTGFGGPVVCCGIE